MEFFSKAKAVRLRSHLSKYLVADDDEETVRQSRIGSSRKARWVVELVPEKANVIRLKGCNGRYLTASDESFLLGWTGRKVVQTPPASRMDASTEWQPVRDGFQVKLRANGGKFLRANGGTPPWKDSVTHDVPQRTVTQDWVLWSVDVVDIVEFESPGNYISPSSSFSSLPEDFNGSETGSPSVGSRLASNPQIPTQQEGGASERSKSQMDHVDKVAEETNFTPSKPREKTFDAVSKMSVEQDTIKGRSNVDKAFDQETNFNSWTPKEQNSKPSDQTTAFDDTNFNSWKLREQNSKPSDQTKAFDDEANFSSWTPREENYNYRTNQTRPKLKDQTRVLDPSLKEPGIEPSPRAETTASSKAKKPSTPTEDHLDSVFSELESIVSDVGSCSTSFSGLRMEDIEAAAAPGALLPSEEEIIQALEALRECLVLEFSQLKHSRARSKFILALSTLSIAKGSLSQEQMEAAHHFLSNFNGLMMKLDRAERQLGECNNFLRDKNRAYDELKAKKELNLDLKARIDQLEEEEEELLRRVEEIRGRKSKLVDKRAELGEESNSALSKWKEFTSLEPAVLSKQRKFEKRRDEIVEDWSNLRVLFN